MRRTLAWHSGIGCRGPRSRHTLAIRATEQETVHAAKAVRPHPPARPSPPRRKAAGTVPQGRHRRDQRHAPEYGPSAGPGEASQPAPDPLTRTPPPRLMSGPLRAPPSVPGAQPAPARRASGSPAVRVGGARARIREAPGEPDARAVPGPPPDRYQGRSPAELAAAADTRTEALARAAAGIPHQAGEAGRPSRRGARGRPADGPAVRGAALPGTAADRGRPPGLRLARGHPVAAVGRGPASRRPRSSRRSTGWPSCPSGSRNGWPPGSTRSLSGRAASRSSTR